MIYKYDNFKPIVFIFALGMLIISSPFYNCHDQKRDFQKLTSDYVFKGPNSVPFMMFNVLTPGQIQAEVIWQDPDTELSVKLVRKLDFKTRIPKISYAEASGGSPIKLRYEVTPEDINRGVNWLLIVSGTDKADMTRKKVKGTINLRIPYSKKQFDLFQKDRIPFRAGDLIPTVLLQTKFETDLAATKKGGLHGIITLKRAIDCVEARQLEELGIIRQSFLSGRSAYGYVLKDTNLNHPLIKSVLKHIIPLGPEDKVDPHIWMGNYAHFVVTPENGPAINYVLNKDGTINLSVLFAKNVPSKEAQSILSAETMTYSAITDYLWLCTIKPAKLTTLAKYDEVEWVESAPVPPLPSNSRTRQMINVDPVQNATINAAAGTINYAGLSGAGVTAGVCDSQVDALHNDLNVVNNSPGAHFHGTHVAGIIGGSGIQSSLHGGTAFEWRGMAPNTAIIESLDFHSAAIVLDEIQNNSLDLVNHSHIFCKDGDYNTNNQTIDQMIRGGASSNGIILPRRPHIGAAANNGGNTPQYGNLTGYFSLLQQTKNTIAAGSWNSLNNTLAGFSSMGPAHDGRLKPDVVAPGVNITSTGTRENEIQVIEYQPGNPNPTQGTFTLTFNGQTTGNLNYNSLTADIQTQLEALNNINPGDINVRGGPLPGDGIFVEFVGPFVFSNVNAMTTMDTNMNNGAVTQVRTVLGGHDDFNGYDVFSGTSMASPAISGVVSLLLESWQRTYNAAMGINLDINPPFPATLRALLIQTAVDIVNPNVRGAGDVCNDVDLDSIQGNGNDGQGPVAATIGPDFATGWGLVDAQSAVNLLEDYRTVNNSRIPNRIFQGAVNQGGIKEYDFIVNQVGPLRVTLAWDDIEGAVQNPAINTVLVNDLDLELVDPNGIIHYPWQLGQEIQDLNGNVLAENAQPPGTAIQVVIPITPNANSANNEYIPANAFTGNGDWVASTGKDHLNNVEQVFIQNVQANQIGHWKLRVIGFNVVAGAQDFSVVGFPYPDLAELEVSCTAKVGLPGIAVPITFTWEVQNAGAVATGGPGTNFDYQIWLSKDFYLDANDVALNDTNQTSLGPLGANGSVQHTSIVQISQADADNLLGTSAGTATIQMLQDEDVFLLVQVDSSDDVLEHNETNIAFVQMARPADVVLVIDHSGSMSGTVPVSDGTQTKIEVLKKSVSLFLDMFRQGAGDQLAEVSFSSSSDIKTIFRQGTGLTPFDSGNIEQARTAVNNLQPATSTDIRGGLQKGLDLITAGANAGSRRVIIFFSDGKKTDGGDPRQVSFLQQFDNSDVHVYSVGFGTLGGTGYSSINVDLLSDLSNANPNEPGFFHVTENPVALDKFFVNAVAGAIGAQVVVDPEGELNRNQSRKLTLPLTTQDYAATFVLTWDNPDSKLDLIVRSPSGFEFTPGNSAYFGDFIKLYQARAYTLMSIQLPIKTGPNTNHEGVWEMEIQNPGPSKVHYAASVLSESTIRAELAPPQPLYPVEASGRVSQSPLLSLSKSWAALRFAMQRSQFFRMFPRLVWLHF